MDFSYFLCIINDDHQKIISLIQKNCYLCFILCKIENKIELKKTFKISFSALFLGQNHGHCPLPVLFSGSLPVPVPVEHP